MVALCDCLWICVWLWSWMYSRVRKKTLDKWRIGDCVGVGWNGIMSEILWKFLPTKHSLLPCKWKWLDKDLFNRTNAEFEAVNSLISIPQGWLAKNRVSQPENVPAKPNIDLLNGVRESETQISCQLFTRLFSGPIDALCLINTSLRRCDYMLELLMGSKFSKSSIKGVLTNSVKKMGSKESHCRCLHACVVFDTYIIHSVFIL